MSLVCCKGYVAVSDRPCPTARYGFVLACLQGENVCECAPLFSHLNNIMPPPVYDDPFSLSLTSPNLSVALSPTLPVKT